LKNIILAPFQAEGGHERMKKRKKNFSARNRFYPTQGLEFPKK